MRYHLEKMEKQVPISKIIIENIYVDNVIIGLDSFEQLLQFYSQAKELFFLPRQ